MLAIIPSMSTTANSLSLEGFLRNPFDATEVVVGGVGREALRGAMVTKLTRRLEQGSEAARELLESQRDGMSCVRLLSDVMDGVMKALHHAATRHAYPITNPTQSERIAVVAVGGYGRGTLAPGSDVDVLFLLPHKQTAWGESVIETMLYPLWDMKLKVGHSTRSIDDCVREARGDMTTRTALLEARFICGDRALFDEFGRRFVAEVIEGTAAAFVEAKLLERDTRVNRAGRSRYLVEPNVKDGKGGLRDLNTLFWIARYTYKVETPEELVGAGLFTKSELAVFRRSEAFLWRVRSWMHFITGRPEERLSFDLQRLVAERIGYAGRDGLSSVERFMKAYFLVAKDVGDLTAIVCAAMEERQAKPSPTLGRLMETFQIGRFRRNRKELGHPDFAMRGERIAIADQSAFERDPVNLIRLFQLAGEHNLAIDPHTTQLARRSLKLIDTKLRNNPEANRLLVEILTSRKNPDSALRRMNEAGVLGRFVPEFGRIVAMMQFNMYHHYTVDEHLIRALGVLAEIDAGRLEAEHPLANAILPHIANRRALYVALFLHDIAKGRKEDHSIEGAKIARKLGPRLGLSEAETETCAWLVQEHLTMSMIAQNRDLGDPKTIEGFAAIVQSLERLKLLLVLTVADIKAVGPGVWNGWKGELLRTLYYETEVVLSGGHSAIERGSRVRRAQDALTASLADWSEAARAAYVARHYPAYWLKVEAGRQERHARFLAEMEAQARMTASQVRTDAFRGVTELTIVAPDHPRLLAIITGACAAAGGNIVDAQIFTTTDGLALDTIFVSRAFDQDEDELRRGERIALAIERALKGEVKIADLVAERRAPPPRAGAFTVAPEVIVDNALSSRYTVLEVSGLDRPGLLYDLTTAIGKLNLNIASAHIATFGERVVDAFYVTGISGGKVTSAGRQQTIRKALTEVFAAYPIAEKAVMAKAARGA
jgi:[protein-PII] uridylyltransferase